MPVSIQISVDASEAIAMLQAGAGGIQNAISQALQKAGQEMQDTAKSIVPVRTGHLRSTISYSVGENELSLTASASYAAYVEYGTRRMTGRPYIRPAVYANIGQLQSDIAEAVAQAFGE